MADTTNRPNETQNIRKTILPLLDDEAGWDDDDDIDEQVRFSVGPADIVLSVNGKRMAVVEAKRPDENEDAALKQAMKYAKAGKIPLAIATDGKSFLKTCQMKTGEPLVDHEGKEIGLPKLYLLHAGNMHGFAKNPNFLKVRVKSDDEMRAVFRKLNKLGKDIGLATGVERVVEIAKIVFVKMLCDNLILLDPSDWDYIASRKDKIAELNSKLARLEDDSKGGVVVPPLAVNKSKNGVVSSMVGILGEVDLHQRHRDATGTLFQEFLSERARGGGSSDLGQYFTPKKIVELMYVLSGYKDGDRVYDPFCGTGGVLMEFFLQHTDKLPPDEKKKFGNNCLFGSEITNAVAMLAKMNMVLAGDGHSNIENSDSLSASNRYVAGDDRFDIVASNMPFDPSVPDDTPDQYFKLSLQSSDAAKFVEHCLLRTKSQGKTVLITGKGFLSEKRSAGFRKQMLETRRLEAVYTLYGGVFEPYTQALSCLLVISKKEPASHVDFFSIENDSDIAVSAEFHNSPDKYEHGYKKVAVSDILKHTNIDLRGTLYTRRKSAKKFGDLVDHVTPDPLDNPADNLLKLTTPNAIDEGALMVPSRSNKKTGKGAGSFVIPLQENALVVSRLTNTRKQSGRYIGSARVGDHAGHLTTAEYHQFIPKNEKDLFFLLAFLRSDEFQEITELASGTGGQQRVEVDVILDWPIPQPTDELRQAAEEALLRIEEQNASITDIEQQRQQTSLSLKKYPR